MRVDIFNTTEKYSIIYADPPWKYGGSGSCKGWPANFYYPTLSDNEIINLLREPLSRITEKDCLLFMWATGPHLKEQIAVGEALGFKYITVGFVWHKKRANTGNYTMSGCEFCLIFKKKGGKIPKDHVRNPGVLQFFEQRSFNHSEKPSYLADQIKVMFPTSKKLELFARTSKEGYDYWNNTKDDKVFNGQYNYTSEDYNAI